MAGDKPKVIYCESLEQDINWDNPNDIPADVYRLMIHLAMENAVRLGKEAIESPSSDKRNEVNAAIERVKKLVEGAIKADISRPAEEEE